MKTITSIICLTMMLLIGANMNAGTSPSFEINTSVKKEIRSKLKLSLEESQKVEVRFVTGENGKPEQVIAITRNEKLKNEIERNFTLMNFSFLQQATAYSVVIDFEAR